jgi:hypothetical protein
LTAAADLPVIRIHSDRKGPEAVVIDTSVPIQAAPVVAAQAAPAVVAAAPAVQAVSDFPPKARIREAFAQFRPEATPEDAKKHEQKPQAKRRIVRAHIAPHPRMMLVAQQPRFGFFGNNTAWW